MNLTHLRYFVEVAHSPNYAMAADRLHTTQPNLTYAVNQLEAELGVVLVTKNGRINQLTSYGKQFLSYAEGTLRTLDSGVNAIHRSVMEHTVIRVGFLRYLGIEYIPHLVENFRKAFPEYKVEFEFETGSTASLFEGLSANRLDIVFCAPSPSRNLHGKRARVSRQKLVVIAPLDHPLCGKKNLSLVDTLNYPYIYYVKGSGMRHICDPYFKEIGVVEPNIRYELLEEHVVTGFVSAGLGIGIVPDMYLLKNIPVEKLDMENKSMGRDIYMVMTESPNISPLLTKFYEYAQQCAEISQENQN